jgi:hypothetical protein
MPHRSNAAVVMLASGLLLAQHASAYYVPGTYPEEFREGDMLMGACVRACDVVWAGPMRGIMDVPDPPFRPVWFDPPSSSLSPFSLSPFSPFLSLGCVHPYPGYKSSLARVVAVSVSVSPQHPTSASSGRYTAFRPSWTFLVPKRMRGASGVRIQS